MLSGAHTALLGPVPRTTEDVRRLAVALEEERRVDVEEGRGLNPKDRGQIAATSPGRVLCRGMIVPSQLSAGYSADVIRRSL